MILATLRDSAIYVVPTILSRGIGFLMLPVYTYYLSPAEYGFVDLLMALYMLMLIVLPLEISQAVSRFMPDEESVSEKARLASSAFWFTATIFSLAAIIVLIRPQIIAELFDIPTGQELVIQLFGVSMTLNALFYAIKNQLRFANAPKASAMTDIAYAATNAACAAVCLIVFEMGAEGAVFGLLFGGLAALATGVWLARRHVPLIWSFNARSIKSMLEFSLPLVLSSAAVYGATFLDRWLLNAMMSTDSVGIYAVGYRIAAVVGMAVYAVQMAVTPQVFQNYRSEGAADSLEVIFRIFVWAILSGLGFLYCLAPLLVEVMSAPEYAQASEIVLPLSIGVVLLGCYVFAPGLGIAKKTKVIAAINVAVVTTNLVINVSLIPILGREGSALASIGGGIAMFFLYAYLGQKYFSLPFKSWRYLTAALLFGIFYLVAEGTGSLLASLLLAAGFPLIYGLVLFSSEELGSARNAIQDFFSG